MSLNAPTLALLPAQVAAVASFLLGNPALARAYGLAPAEVGAPLADSPETRTYHLGATPTPGRGYDDRLTMRLGPSRSTLAKQVELWAEFGGRRGGLAHTRIGSHIWVSETDCRAYMSATSRP